MGRPSVTAKDGFGQVKIAVLLIWRGPSRLAEESRLLISRQEGASRKSDFLGVYRRTSSLLQLAMVLGYGCHPKAGVRVWADSSGLVAMREALEMLSVLRGE